MSESILVTGGTGVVGRHLVARLLESAPDDVRVLTRSPRSDVPYTAVRGDLATGAGLGDAVAGTRTIVHLASESRKRGADVEAARRLIDAARRSESGHLLFISIVGVGRHPYFYYQEKLEVERMIETSGVPYTILRTTQFHDFVLFLTQSLTRLPVVPIPTWSVQPVDTEEVAERLAELALGEPSGRVADMGGPEILTVRDVVRAYLAASGQRRLLVPLPLPGKGSAATRRGVHLTPDHATGVRTYGDFLAERVKPGQPARGYGDAGA
jgi:uncharacterized protein YbjT (DUF2867 family)